MPKARPKRGEARRPEAERPEHDAFVTAIGRLVRLSRAKRGVTRRQLAQESGASERYLAQIEGGQGNPSVLILKSIAQALDVPIIDLLPRANGRPAAMTHVLDVLARTPAAELPALAELIESHAARHVAADRGRRIALVGLRGAGKSTLGRRLAEEFACPFIELDRLVEQDYGARIPDLIEMAGLATFRRYERACLERVIDEHDAAVIATAGGIVVECRHLRAAFAPHPHGLDQGTPRRAHAPRDGAGGLPPHGAEPRGHGRPGRHPGRAPRRLCARAAELDTSGDTVEQSFAKLALVIAAFDPAMHPSSGKRPLSMDARAKPGHDGLPHDDVKQRQL